MIDVAMIEDLIRDTLDVPDERRLPSAEILAAANDGYREVGSRAFCVEREVDVAARTGERIIAFTGHRVAQVELLSGIKYADYIFADYLVKDADYIFADSLVADWEATGSYQWDEEQSNGGAVWEASASYKWDEEAMADPAIVISRPLLHITPYMMGWLPYAGEYPQYWFTWGNRLVVDPPGLGDYLCRLYVHDYPAAAMLAAADGPVDLPETFQPVVVDFALYILALKLRRFRTAVKHYNNYILNMARRRREFTGRKAQGREINRIPAQVNLQ